MAALDRLDELEDFMLRLQPEETFRPHSLWRLPLLGSHDYRLPETVEERLGDLAELARELADAPVEVTVFATDVSNEAHGQGAARVRALRTRRERRRPRRWRRRSSRPRR